MSLFNIGNFQLHAGGISDFKIDCDVLTDADWNAIALQLVPRLPAFGSVEGVPRGGLRLAQALQVHATTGPLLIVDDVLTSGASMDTVRAGRDAIGAVLFARNPCPSWIFPLFQMSAAGKQ